MLKASHPKIDQVDSLDNEHILIEHLNKKDASIVYDELKMTNDVAGNSSNQIMQYMENASINAIMPITMENNLLGFLTLGEPDEKGVFTEDLLGVLTAFCNQAALAIENAMFVEERDKTHAQRSEKT